MATQHPLEGDTRKDSRHAQENCHHPRFGNSGRYIQRSTQALGVATVTEALNTKIARQDQAIKKRKAVTRKFGNRLTARTKRVAAASLASIPGEAIPFLGFGILVAGTAYELYEACKSMKDLDELYAGLGMADEVPGDLVREVCGGALKLLWVGVKTYSRRV